MSIVITVVQETRTDLVLDAPALRTHHPRPLHTRRLLTLTAVSVRPLRRPHVVSEGDRVPADASFCNRQDLRAGVTLTGESVALAQNRAKMITPARSTPAGSDDLAEVFSGLADCARQLDERKSTAIGAAERDRQDSKSLAAWKRGTALAGATPPPLSAPGARSRAGSLASYGNHALGMAVMPCWQELRWAFHCVPE